MIVRKLKLNVILQGRKTEGAIKALLMGSLNCKRMQHEVVGWRQEDTVDKIKNEVMNRICDKKDLWCEKIIKKCMDESFRMVWS